ncbi:MAG: methyltransferase domain-containing protein [Reyranellaceae bacterium]
MLRAMAWDPAQYLKFAGERLQPAIDLLSRIPATPPGTVVDVGCGAGNMMPLLAARWPGAKLAGVDGSPEMLARARKDHPAARFIEADLNHWRTDAPADVLFSNAALHWLDGHDTLFPSLLKQLAPGGWLAVQMPRNFEAPSHSTVVDTINNGPWRDTLMPVLRPRPVAPPDEYWRLLSPLAASVAIWEIEYLQVLKGENPVAEFTKGSWLPQFLTRLEEPLRSRFESEYRARVLKAYPKEADGSTLFRFRRLFILAQAKA